MTETLDPPKKRTTKRYSVETQKEALRQCSLGTPQPKIAAMLGIPQQTIAHWACKSGIRRQGPQSIANRVDQSLSKAIDGIAAKATDRVAKLLEQSHNFGNKVLRKANRLVTGDIDPGELVSVANAGKVGVSIARQALGLSDSTEQVIVRLDLMSASKPAQPVIDIGSCGVSEQPVNANAGTADTTSDKHQ